MRRTFALLLVGSLVAVAAPTTAMAADERVTGAAVGAGVGLLAGGGKGAAKGALVGGGVGALTSEGDKEKTKNYGKKGALAGAGVGLLTDGVGGAAKGAIYGGSVGAIFGKSKDKNK